MKKTDTKSTSSTSQDESKNDLIQRFSAWIIVWWPAVLIIAALSTSAFTKYIIPNERIHDLATEIAKAVGLLMAVFYVIYTRILAVETKKMAEASIGMFDSDKGTVLIELSEGNCNFSDLCEDVQEITKEIHIADKKVSEGEFEKLISENSLPGIYARIKNRSGRRIDPSRVEFTARHTGSDNKHDIACNISKVGNIGPWEDLEVFLIASPEGEVEITLSSVDYLDGGVVQRKNNLGYVVVLERIRKPEN